MIGATNEPPSIAKLRWAELGALEWVFAVAPRHPLAKAPEPLQHDNIVAHRGVGWLPRPRVRGMLRRGVLVEKQTANPREPNVLYAAWRGDHEGRALA